MKYAAGLVRAACKRDVARVALKVSLLVGLVLNAVNQGGAILDGEPVILGKLILNFVVPYCVSSYSAAVNSVRRTSKEHE